MDRSQFDALVVSLREMGSRRRLLGVLAALPIGGLAASLGSEEGEARRKGQGRKRSHRPGKHKDNRKGKRRGQRNGGLGRGDGCTVLGQAGCRWNEQERIIICQGSNLANKVIPHDCILDGAVFRNVNLTNADFSNFIRLQGAGFSGVTFDGARFDDALLFLAKLRLANLSNSYLTNADLGYADLTGANLYNASLTGVIWRRTICPDGFVTSTTCCGHLNGAVPRDGC